MLISGETARYELTHLNLHCLQKTQIFPVALKELNNSHLLTHFYILIITYSLQDMRKDDHDLPILMHVANKVIYWRKIKTYERMI